MIIIMMMVMAVVMMVVMIVIVSAHEVRISPPDAACRGLRRNAAITLVLAAPDGIVASTYRIRTPQQWRRWPTSWTC
ncbi:MAG: hypothetical protein U0987_02430 [Afipia sp.]|nr:hypothetical protein [Afipia sp.]